MDSGMDVTGREGWIFLKVGDMVDSFVKESEFTVVAFGRSFQLFVPQVHTQVKSKPSEELCKEAIAISEPYLLVNPSWLLAWPQ